MYTSTVFLTGQSNHDIQQCVTETFLGDSNFRASNDYTVVQLLEASNSSRFSQKLSAV